MGHGAGVRPELRAGALLSTRVLIGKYGESEKESEISNAGHEVQSTQGATKGPSEQRWGSTNRATASHSTNRDGPNKLRLCWPQKED